MIVYYAHSMALYGTPQEARDIELLTRLGYDTRNPNRPAIQAECLRLKAVGVNPMEPVFKPLVISSDVLAFRALPDGTIPAGVAKEIQWARDAGIPVIELPSGVQRRVLTLDETREYLHEVGQR